MRADEAPTQQIPLAAEYASLARRPAEDEDEGEETPPEPLHFPSAEERTAEIPVAAARALFEPPAAVPAPSNEDAETGTETEASSPLAEEPAPVPREIEELASTTSIGQLKEMLSSVSRSGAGAGSLSDDEIDRLASRVVERLSDKIVREIAWEVIPDVAELVIKQRIKELESGVE